MPAHPNSLRNLNRNGRPKGAVGKRAQLLKRLDPEIMDLSLTPKEAMAMAMVYYQRKANELLERIKEAKDQGIPISEYGQEMKLVRDYYDAMAECAAKLAPFIHPKLAAVEVKTEQTQPYVIRVPAVETSADQWARNFSEPPPKVIDVTPSNGSDK